METLTPTFSNTLPFIPADSAAARLPDGIGAVPAQIVEALHRAALALDRLEFGADAVAQRFEPVTGRLLLVVEGFHADSLIASRLRRARPAPFA